jgi:hypothetical protein
LSRELATIAERIIPEAHPITVKGIHVAPLAAELYGTTGATSLAEALAGVTADATRLTARAAAISFLLICTFLI